MIEKALETLEREKEIAVEKIREMNNLNIDEYLKCEMKCEEFIGKPINQEKLKEAAIKEIEVNYISIKRNLNKLKKLGFNIHDDLTMITDYEVYKSNEDYKIIIGSILTHHRELNLIPTNLQIGKYYPSYRGNDIRSISELISD